MATLTAFDLAHTFTAKWEGGLADHPADPGGITNFGVSLRFLQNFAQNQDNREWLARIGIILPINERAIRTLNADHARHIFKRFFWDGMKLDNLPLLTSIATYDAAVNTGRGQSVKFLQRACNTLPGERLEVDGLIGPKTYARAQESKPDSLLAGLCINERDTFYKCLVSGKPNYSPFLQGWLNRIAALRKYIHNLGAV